MNETVLYTPPQEIRYILEGHGGPHRIMAEGETPQDLLNRIVETLIGVEEKFGTSPEIIEHVRKEFIQYFIHRDFIPGIPTLTNAGREGYDSSALSSCVVIPVDLRSEVAQDVILRYYKQNMGSGFNLTKYQDPVAMLRWLNTLSANETASGQYSRRIANMGTLHVAHPQIRQFIQAKVHDKSLIHFNISVEITDDFMNAVMTGSSFKTIAGIYVNAHDLLQEISQAAWACGDPGLINLDRMNKQNPIASIAAYDCSPPCGEMGLALGETCQFGYINILHYVNADGSIRMAELAGLVHHAVRILDNAVEYGVDRQPSLEGQQMTRLKRKIGISVAGLADALIKIGVPYDSEKGRSVARDILSFINYQAKVASVELANERGSCNAMKFGLENLYYSGYTANRYAHQKTNTVTAKQWMDLDEIIRSTGMLRNIHHTALPPGGRASMVLGVNHSIEPIFSPSHLGLETSRQVIDILARSAQVGADIQTLLNNSIEQGTFQNLPISNEAKRLLRTVIEIQPEDHVLMAAVLSGMDGVYDESVSKTVNLPHSATPEDIFQIYVLAHQVGLKNISVYRDGSLSDQPRKLS